MQSLDNAIVWRQEAVVEEPRERDLMVGEVAECSAELGRGRLVQLAEGAPRRELVPDWLAARSPRGELGVIVELANRRALGAETPFIVCDPRRGNTPASVRSPANYVDVAAAFEAATQEMAASLVRTAFSPNIKERADCSTALCDASGRA